MCEELVDWKGGKRIYIESGFIFHLDKKNELIILLLKT